MKHPRTIVLAAVDLPLLRKALDAYLAQLRGDLWGINSPCPDLEREEEQAKATVKRIKRALGPPPPSG